MSSNLISRLILIAIIVHVVYLCFDFDSIFSLHPSCMTVGYLLFMFEAILSLSPAGLPILKSFNKTTVHWVLQVCASSLIAVAFIAIVIVKFTHDKPHFQSWHAFLGLISVCCIVGTNSGGTGALYAIALKKYIKPAQIKNMHSFFGILTFMLGIITLILGFYTKWFVNNTHEIFSWLYSGLVLVITLRILSHSFQNLAVRSGAK